MIPLCRFPRNCLSLEKFHILEGDSQPDLDIGQNGCLFPSSFRQESSDRMQTLDFFSQNAKRKYVWGMEQPGNISVTRWSLHNGKSQNLDNLG